MPSIHYLHCKPEARTTKSKLREERYFNFRYEKQHLPLFSRSLHRLKPVPVLQHPHFPNWAPRSADKRPRSLRELPKASHGAVSSLGAVLHYEAGSQEYQHGKKTGGTNNHLGKVLYLEEPGTTRFQIPNNSASPPQQSPSPKINSRSFC